MKKSFFLAAAAALLISTAAQAGGFSFEINGQKVRIDAARNCNSLSCLSVTNNGSPVDMSNVNFGKKKSNNDDDFTNDAPQASAPAPAPVARVAPPAPPAPPAPVANNYAPPAPPAPPPPSYEQPAPRAEYQQPRDDYQPRPRYQPRAEYAPAPAPAPAPVANNYAPPPAPAPQPEPAPAAAPIGPLGVWATADNKGNVRIEQCGANLCGYSEKTNEKVLINMKPSADKWSGRIHDPDSGSNYDSTIAMKGPNQLKVQGCAFGGMFCGGQTWKRVS